MPVKISHGATVYPSMFAAACDLGVQPKLIKDMLTRSRAGLPSLLFGLPIAEYKGELQAQQPKKKAKKIKAPQPRGSSLLKPGHCTHRMGVYHGQGR